MIIGGGFIRDAVLGGEIGDIDVWLPSQTRIEASTIENHAVFNGTDVIFQLNTTSTSAPISSSRDDYRDLSNLLVVETRSNGIRINFIKSMTPWETPEQFFETMFRNFDTEISMFFMGFAPDGDTHREIQSYSEFNAASVSTLILPRSYQEIASEGGVQDIIAINPVRVGVTSRERMNTRYSKLCSRYSMRRDDLFAYNMSDIDFPPIRIRLSDFSANLLELMPYPTAQETTSWPNTDDTSARATLPLLEQNMIQILRNGYMRQVFEDALTTHHGLNTSGNMNTNRTSVWIGGNAVRS